MAQVEAPGGGCPENWRPRISIDNLVGSYRFKVMVSQKHHLAVRAKNNSPVFHGFVFIIVFIAFNNFILFFFQGCDLTVRARIAIDVQSENPLFCLGNDEFSVGVNGQMHRPDVILGIVIDGLARVFSGEIKGFSNRS